MKPMLASDFDESRIHFPVILQPKIDGVRALNMTGTLTGRSLKKHKNIATTERFSHSLLVGLDGEMAAERETHPDLCRLTSSALSTIKNDPYVLWHLFDYITPAHRNFIYQDRLMVLQDKLTELNEKLPHIASRLRIVPSHTVNNLEQLLALENKWLEEGYEGAIIRDVEGAHKQGRSTIREGGLLRIKRFIDFEFEVVEVLEGEQNANEAQTNELGNTFRSTHKDNMIPNAMVGAMMGKLLTVVKDGDKLLFNKGDIVKVGAGCLPHDQRKYFFANPAKIIGRIGKAKFFPKGMKDKLRFPTFQSFRDPVDISK